MYTCNTRIWEVEAGGEGVQGQSGLESLPERKKCVKEGRKKGGKERGLEGEGNGERLYPQYNPSPVK